MPHDKLTPTTGCGCHMDTVSDDEPSDLCSEGTGMHDGVSWIMRMCPMHRAAPDLFEACKRMLSRLETEAGWLEKADYPARFAVERAEHLDVYRDIIAKAENS